MDKKNIVFYIVFFLIIIIIILTIVNQLNLTSYRIKNKHKPKFIDLINTKLNDNSPKLIFLPHPQLFAVPSQEDADLASPLVKVL